MTRRGVNKSVTVYSNRHKQKLHFYSRVDAKKPSRGQIKARCVFYQREIRWADSSEQRTGWKIPRSQRPAEQSLCHRYWSTPPSGHQRCFKIILCCRVVKSLLMAPVTASYQCLHQALLSPDTTTCFQWLFTVPIGVRRTLTESPPSTCPTAEASKNFGSTNVFRRRSQPLSVLFETYLKYVSAHACSLTRGSRETVTVK